MLYGDDLLSCLLGVVSISIFDKVDDCSSSNSSLNCVGSVCLYWTFLVSFSFLFLLNVRGILQFWKELQPSFLKTKNSSIYFLLSFIFIFSFLLRLVLLIYISNSSIKLLQSRSAFLNVMTSSLIHLVKKAIVL